MSYKWLDKMPFKILAWVVVITQALAPLSYADIKSANEVSTLAPQSLVQGSPLFFNDAHLIALILSIAKHTLTDNKAPASLSRDMGNEFGSDPAFRKYMRTLYGASRRMDVVTVPIDIGEARYDVRICDRQNAKDLEGQPEPIEIIGRFAVQAVRLGAAVRASSSGGPDMKGKDAPESDDIIRRLTQDDRIVELSLEDDSLKANRVKWVDNYVSGNTPSEIYMGEEVDVAGLFSETEMKNLKNWIKNHPVRAGPVRFRIALNEAALGWKDAVEHSNIAHAGYRDHSIYIGHFFLKYLMSESKSAGSLRGKILEEDELRHLLDPDATAGHHAQKSYTETLKASGAVIEQLAAISQVWKNLGYLWDKDMRALHERAGALFGDTALIDEKSAKQLQSDYEAYLDGGKDEKARARRDELRAKLGLKPGEAIVYDSMEYALNEKLLFFAGGLGALAGDHARAASDFLPRGSFVCVGAYYKLGYLSQIIDLATNWQTESYERMRIEESGEIVTGSDGRDMVIQLPMPDGEMLYAKAWRLQVGRTELYLMTTDIDENSKNPEYRKYMDLTYDANEEVRIVQEYVVGVGGERLMDRLGIRTRMLHLNEGHVSFAILEKARQLMIQKIKILNDRTGLGFSIDTLSNIPVERRQEYGLTIEDALDTVRHMVGFTSHTPIAAGNQKFQYHIAEKYLNAYLQTFGGSFADIAFEPAVHDGYFDMTEFALNYSNFFNGVSRKHAEVCRDMYRATNQKAGNRFGRDRPEATNITNAIDRPYYQPEEMQALLERKLNELKGKGEMDGSVSLDELSWHDAWTILASVSNKELEAVSREMIANGLNELRAMRSASSMPGSRKLPVIDGLDIKIDPEAFIIVFGRRIAGYKRPAFVLEKAEDGDIEVLRAIVREAKKIGRKVQFVFVGKAHRTDDAGKALLQKILHAAKYDEELKGSIIFIENYNTAVAKVLVKIAAVALNNPEPPNEASGTSGMKFLTAGKPSVTVMDGWTLEALSHGSLWGVYPFVAKKELRDILIGPWRFTNHAGEEILDGHAVEAVPSHEPEGRDGNNIYECLDPGCRHLWSADPSGEQAPRECPKCKSPAIKFNSFHELGLMDIYFNHKARWYQIMRESMAMGLSYFTSHRMFNEYIDRMYARTLKAGEVAEARFMEIGLNGAGAMEARSSSSGAPSKEPRSASSKRILFSILDAPDFSLMEEVRDAKSAKIEAIHIDYLDGKFTPGSPAFDCEGQIQKIVGMEIPLQVHFMCEEPDFALVKRMVDAGLKPGRDRISLHYESFKDPEAFKALAENIREAGFEVSVVLNPETPLSVLDSLSGVLGKGLNSIMLMAIVPGARSRPFIPTTIEKIRALKKFLHQRGLENVEIQADGGINDNSLEGVLETGIDGFVSRTWLLESGRRMDESVKRVNEMAGRIESQNKDLDEIFSRFGFGVDQYTRDAIADFCNGSEVFSADEIKDYIRLRPGVTRVEIDDDKVIDVYNGNTLLRFHKTEVVPIEHFGLKDRAYYKGVTVKVYEGNFNGADKGKYVLGISGSWHDSTAVLLKNGKMIAALEEERITRTKHDTSLFPVNAIHTLLKNEGIKLDDVSHIAIGWNYNSYVDTPHSKAPNDEFFEKMNEDYAKGHGTTPDVLVKRNVPEKNKARFDVRSVEAFLDELKRYYRTSRAPNVSFVRHHLAHAASAYYPSGFKEPTLVVSLDGYGDTDTGTIWIGSGGRMEEVTRFELPNSMGWVWAAMTEYLGFKPTFAEGEVMGFAPYGEPRDAEEMERVRGLREIFDDYLKFDYETGKLFANPEYLYYGEMAPGKMRITKTLVERLKPLVPPSAKNSKAIDPLLQEDRPLANLAFVLQEATDRIVSDIVRYHLEKNPKTRYLKKVALGGGIALNILSNGKLISDGLVKGEDIFVQPAASDAGTAIGAALAVANKVYGKDVGFEMTNAYYGPEYSDDDIRATLEKFGLLPGIDYVRGDDNELVERAAQCVKDNEPIAWFQGRSELGPRALGARSVILSLLDDTSNNSANRIKARQPWRPSASSIIAEAAGDYFTGIGRSPFMIIAYEVAPDKKHLMASGVHQYGKRLARPQTVDRKSSPLYWRLLKKVGDLIGVPAVVNTSFNKQEPLVENPEEAINTFRYMDGVNKLFIGHYIVTKSERIIPTVVSLADERQLGGYVSQAMSSGDINDFDRLFSEVSKLYPRSHKIAVAFDCGVYGTKEIFIPLVKELFEGPFRGVLLRYATSVIYNYAVRFNARRVYIGATSEKMDEVVFTLLRDNLKANFNRMDYFANFGESVEILPILTRSTASPEKISARNLLKLPSAGERKGIYVGVDVGATKIKLVLLKDNKEIKRAIVDTTYEGGPELKSIIKKFIKEAAEGLDTGELSGIGIALPGVVEPNKNNVK